MLESISEDIKRIFLFGIGAVATTAEKSKELIDELVAKGELTVEQGKILNEELKHNIKESLKDATAAKNENPPTADTVVENMDKMTPEEIQKIKAKIEMMEAEPASKEIVSLERADKSGTDESK
jgi:polyhydroxyalkanoate synthesis regulator phasin